MQKLWWANGSGDLLSQSAMHVAKRDEEDEKELWQTLDRFQDERITADRFIFIGLENHADRVGYATHEFESVTQPTSPE